MIIDCHGHLTTEPAALLDFRRSQFDHLAGYGPHPEPPEIADDELRTAVEAGALRLQRERGTDLTLLSPRAAGMRHDIDDVTVASAWARASNAAIERIVALYPRNFAAVAQLPQTPSGDLGPVLDELARCVDAGFVACNVNPDPSGGRWSAPPLTDAAWTPLWDALERLGLPAMIHASASMTRAAHTTGAHYLSADTVAFMQLVEGDLFQRHPGLKLVIPHGGGAVPYHWGRFRGLALALGKGDLAEHVLGNVFFDTCVYHQAGIDLLTRVIPSANILFGSELLGAVRSDDPDTGRPFDDTRAYLDAAGLDSEARVDVLGGNARRVYPRLDDVLTGQGR